MVSNIIDYLKEVEISNRYITKNYNNSKAHDPLAQEIDWFPEKIGEASFCTYNLKEVNTQRLEFHASAMAIIFYLTFFLVGVSVIGTMISGMVNQTSHISVFLIISVGTLFVTIGTIMLYSGIIPIVFDKGSGYFWRGRKKSNSPSKSHEQNNAIELDRIHAIQLLSESCSSNNSSFYSYEMNLVLKDKSRLNVIDHGSLKKIKRDAEILSDFLDVPVWENIS